MGQRGTTGTDSVAMGAPGAVVLLHPAVGDFDKYKGAPTLPLSLLMVAAALPSDQPVRIIDRRVDPSWRATLCAALTAGPVCVGVTAMTGPMIASALEMTRLVRQESSTPIVWGGVHASLLPAATLREDLVDAVVQGEGEVAFPTVVAALREGRQPEGAGIWWKARPAPPRAPLLDVEGLPEPRYTLVSMSGYRERFLGRLTLPVQSSRGCPRGCAFCYNPAFNLRRWRGQSHSLVEERIARLQHDYAVEDIHFVDDNFFVDVDRGFRILEGLRRRGLTWHLQGMDLETIERLSDRDLDRLGDLGARRIVIGLESGAPRVRKLLEKWGTRSDVLEQVGRLARRGFLVNGSMMAGIPTETEEEVAETVRLLRELLASWPNFRISRICTYTPYPGTVLLDRARELGYEVPERLADWSRFELSSLHLPANRGFERRVNNLSFVSFFLDQKVGDYDAPWWVRLGYSIYAPVARLRFSHGWVDRVPERRLYEWWDRRRRPWARIPEALRRVPQA